MHHDKDRKSRKGFTDEQFLAEAGKPTSSPSKNIGIKKDDKSGKTRKGFSDEEFLAEAGKPAPAPSKDIPIKQNDKTGQGRKNFTEEALLAWLAKPARSKPKKKKAPKPKKPISVKFTKGQQAAIDREREEMARLTALAAALRPGSAPRPLQTSVSQSNFCEKCAEGRPFSEEAERKDDLDQESDSEKDETVELDCIVDKRGIGK